ncbi:MAG: hypothetical protein AAB531_02855 [Patescibacteria group bacterium]
MDNNVSEQLKDLISKNQSIGIAVGKNPSIDAMAAALSLFLTLKSDGKNVNIVCPTEPLVEHSRLVGIDRVKKDFELQGGDMTVSFPYQEGEIEKISYTLENGLLNIIVKAGQDGLTFSEKDVIFKRSEGYPTLLFVIGTSRLSDLDRIYDAEGLKDTTVVNIDNKPDNQGYGDISIVAPNSSSISEKVADIMLSMNLTIDVDIAQNLLTGIENGTDNFQSSMTTPLAFEITGELIRKGAVRSAVSNLQNEMPKAIRDDSDEYDEENLSSVFTQPAPFPRQPQRPQPFRQPQPLTPRINRLPNAGQNLQRLQSMQNRQQGPAGGQDLSSVRQDLSAGPLRSEASRQDLTSERKDTKITERTDPSVDSLRQDSGQAGQGKKPPVDWLTPKIYKGSTNI